uniref:Reverse transcriptase domain-containing protein n=1 Tax=Peronospora matthiolae TaxID=2874970 RepID=A0AAV1V345_9STRA
MRERDIPYTAVSTPSGMLWEWLVMLQGLSNVPATFIRCVTNLLRLVRDIAPSYFDKVFVHSRAMDGKTDVEVHRIHVRKVLTLVREHKLFVNLKKCIFAANEIPLLGCIVGKNGVRPDPEKIKAIINWPVPVDVQGIQKFLGLAAYLHKYSRNYAEMTAHLSRLLKKNERWSWSAECQHSFEGIEKSLIQSPVLAIADQNRPFYVVCDASDFAIGCALMQ